MTKANENIAEQKKKDEKDADKKDKIQKLEEAAKKYADGVATLVTK